MSEFSARLSAILFSEENKTKLSYISLSCSLLLISLLLLCLMPFPTSMSEKHVERRITLVISIALIVVCLVGLIAVFVRHQVINTAILLFFVGISSGCLCAITFGMIFANLLLTFIDIITGDFRLTVMEIIQINILMITLTLMLYFKTSLLREFYEICLEEEKNISTNGVINNVEIVGEEVGTGSANNNSKPAKSSKTTGSYDFN